MNWSEAYNGTYRQVHGQDPPSNVIHGPSDADVISPSRGFLEGFDGTIQTSIGCQAGCLFCYVACGARLAPIQVRGVQGSTWGYNVLQKERAAQKFCRHLHQGKLADKTWYWSGVTDPYFSAPEVTRQIWQCLCDAPVALRPRRLVVQTRFRPDRDAELMASYCQSTQPSDGGPPVVVSYSIGTDRNDLIAVWEKRSPFFEQRMAAVQALRKPELFVVVTLSPFALWNNLTATLRQLQAWGVAYVTVLFFKVGTRSANTPRRFQTCLQEKHPELLDPVWQAEQLQLVRAVYGNRVLVGQAGFSSLARPHVVLEREPCGAAPMPAPASSHSSGH